MIDRLLKDFRCLFPIWFGAVAILALCSLLAACAPIFVVLYPSVLHLDWYILMIAYWVGWSTFAITFFIVGALLFGHEFETGTVTFMASQPVRRTTLWREKMALSLILLLILICEAIGALHYSIHPSQLSGTAVAPPDRDTVLFCFMFGLAGWSIGPAVSLYMRQNFSACIGSMVVFISISIILGVLIPALNNLLLKYGIIISIDAPPHAWGWIYLFLTLVGSFIFYRIGRRLFLNLELTPGHQHRLGEWVKLPGINLPIPSSENSHKKNRVTWLILKEIELQIPVLAFLVSVLLVWLVIYGLTTTPGVYRFTWETMSVIATLRLIFVWASLTFFFPLLVGSTLIASERKLQALDWQLSLPIRRWGQWGIKIGLAFFIVIPIGLLAWPLDQILCGRFETLLREVYSGSAGGSCATVPPFEQSIVFPPIAVGLGIYASSLCRFPYQAVLLAVGLFVVNLYFLVGLEAWFLPTYGPEWLGPISLTGSAAMYLAAVPAVIFPLLAFWNFRVEGYSWQRLTIQLLIWFGVVAVGCCIFDFDF